jgi:hypothetical protein
MNSRRLKTLVCLTTVVLGVLESLIESFIELMSQVLHAANFSSSYQLLTATSAARMDLAIGNP